MRILLKVNLPVDRANQMAKDGTLSSTIKAILDEQKPEAAYFLDDLGMRTGFLFLNLADSSDIPRVTEPWMLAFDAGIELHPVMAPQDLEAAGHHIESAVQKYA